MIARSRKEYFWLLCIMLCLFLRFGQKYTIKVDNGFFSTSKCWIGKFDKELHRVPLSEIGNIKVDWPFRKNLPNLLIVDKSGQTIFSMPYNIYNAGIEPGRVVFKDGKKLRRAIDNNTHFKKSCVTFFPWEIPFLLSLVFYGIERRKRIDRDTGVCFDAFAFDENWRRRVRETIQEAKRKVHNENYNSKIERRKAMIKGKINKLYETYSDTPFHRCGK